MAHKPLEAALAARDAALPRGVAAVLPPPERAMPVNLRVVNNDAELRECLVQAGSDTVW